MKDDWKTEVLMIVGLVVVCALIIVSLVFILPRFGIGGW
jgi:hypothetical protein